MMLEVILQDFAEEGQAKIEELQKELEATYDIAEFEKGLKELVGKQQFPLWKFAVGITDAIFCFFSLCSLRSLR